MKTLALTGHREIPVDFDRNGLYDRLEELIQEGFDVFLCGMAMGFDLLALDCLVSLKSRYRIRLEACVPFNGQENSFPYREKKSYRALIQWCDVVRELYPTYQNGCYLTRNRYMVDRADALFAYCIKDKGGSAYTVEYARNRGIEVKFFP